MPGPGNRPETPRIYSQTPGPGMVPVYSGVGRDGKPTGLLGYEPDLSGGIVEVPKPSEVIALEKKIGTTLEPFYSQGSAPHGGVRDSGPPIGYRYDNGQSQYVNYDTSGNYQSTQDRNNSLLPLLAILAMPFIGPAAFEAMGLGAGGAGLLAGEGTVAALPLSQLAVEAANLTPAAIESLLGTAGYGANASALEFAKQLGLNLATVGAGANLPFPGVTPTPIPTPPPPIPKLTPAAIESLLGTSGYGTNASALEFAKDYGLDLARVGSGANLPFEGVTPPVPEPSKLPSWVTPTNALLAASALSSIAKANETTPTAEPFTMAPYVPPSGKPFANLGMSPIATPYTPTRIAGQYDPTMTPGGVSPYELIMQQMQAPKNLYADFEAGTNIGGFDPQRFVTKPAAVTPVTSSTNNMGGITVSGGLPNANIGPMLLGEINAGALGAASGTALPNYKGGMIDKSRMVGPNPMGPDNGFASIQDGEFVMNRKATQKYGIELMNAINSGKISKGKLSGLLEA
ncbi:hypothetical protein UFOVP377_28 [uncultured Caudovirales phage]|uniref:Uncharacterized protein n=1 Tax=uncultured Caudovirales phage TaxID=2100421 RepID=A0A6J7X0S6_9CAUD|nr:hypothetical protein UFOVP377_28 [uncultured Caudovirales phage]